MTERFSMTVFNRDFSRRITPPWNVFVEKYSKAARGGPKIATVNLAGDVQSLWETLEMLRCPVKIYDNERGKAVWWGIIRDTLVNDGKKQRTASLRDMTNYLQVRYTHNLLTEETSWAFNQNSIDTYGQKELAITENDLDEDQAEQRRDTELEARKFPQVSRPVKASGAPMSQLTCCGLLDTLEWRYYLTDVGLEAFEDETTSFSREVGEDDRPECAQSFQLASAVGWDAYVISIRVRKYKDTNNQNFVMDLCSDNGGEPGSSLAQVSLDYTYFDTSLKWVDFVLGTPVSLIPGVTYWIKCSKVGAISLDECYLVAGDGDRGYPRGIFLIHNIGKDYWYGKPMDMNFRVLGRAETTTQIENMIANASEFLLDTDLLIASGVERNQFRDGQNSVLYELIKLLDMGTSNDRRLHARVLENRHLEVYEEPILFAANYSEDKDGNLYDPTGAVLPKADCPVGIWLGDSGGIPTSVDVSKLIYSSYFFVEQAEYIVATDEYRVLETRNTPVYPGVTRIVNG